MGMKKTILYDIHESMGTKIAPFAGYLMPVQYRGVIAEHMATRNKVTVFDTCHMGELHIHGGNALSDLENILIPFGLSGISAFVNAFPRDPVPPVIKISLFFINRSPTKIFNTTSI